MEFFPWVEELAGELFASRRVPRAAYRLQFGRSFTFWEALELVPYFDDLGISDLYASPLFKPCSEESHGYDICDHQQFNPAIGSQEEFEKLAAALQARSMSLILDVVPNHMGISPNNAWWMDVLENGPSSPFAGYFDIDFQPVKPELQNKILLPILEDQYGKVLESGKFRLAMEEGAFFIHYYHHKLPVAPRSYSKILGRGVEALAEVLGKENECLQDLMSILTALSHLPPQTELDLEKVEERRREKEVIKRRIAALCQKSPEVQAAIGAAVQTFNGAVGDSRSFEPLDDLLRAQAYRPAFWRVASDEINYRRFFDINDLAAIRMELPVVFEEAHRLVFRLLAGGQVGSLRVDHPDGLWDPALYFRALQETYLFHQGRARLPQGAEGVNQEALRRSVAQWASIQAQKEEPAWPLYVVAEKILGEGESLPPDWAVAGTTGYEFLNLVNGLFVDGGNRQALDRLYGHFIGAQMHFPSLLNSSKKMIMLVSLASEIQALSHQLERISEKNRSYRDFTLNTLTFALREIIAALPVYRMYIQGPEGVARRDEAYLEHATEEAKRRNPRTAGAVFDFMRDTLLLRNLGDFSTEDRPRLVRLVMQFQQVTGPVMAKGLEDTAFYVFNRLLSLNEVGGNPERFGRSPGEFHERNLARQQRWPQSLLATSTHDTKRSEDIRARLNVLAEIPGEWRAALSRWSRLNAPKKILVDGHPAPDRNDEYLLYQTLVGAWPMEGDAAETPGDLQLFRQRIAAYMEKATLEAKVHTSWINRNEEYDDAVQSFVSRVLDTAGKNRFPNDLRDFARRVACFGRWNSLAQVLLKLTSPGVPDCYQGAELWDLSLVDPDNRRPVDYRLRCSLLAGLLERVRLAGDDLTALVRELLENDTDGRIKLYLIYRTLHFRRLHARLFASGIYLPLEARGTFRDHLCAFARNLNGEAVIVAVPRLVVRLTGGNEGPPLGEEIWKDTRLALPAEWKEGTFANLYTGEQIRADTQEGTAGIPLAAVFRTFPVALLERVA